MARGDRPTESSMTSSPTALSGMLNFAHVVDRVRPQASLAIGLIFAVAWIGALDYGLLRLEPISKSSEEDEEAEQCTVPLPLVIGQCHIHALAPAQHPSQRKKSSHPIDDGGESRAMSSQDTRNGDCAKPIRDKAT